jgi:hypothetical protein
VASARDTAERSTRCELDAADTDAEREVGMPAIIE